MSTVAEIENAIQKLSKLEQQALRRWMNEKYRKLQTRTLPNPPNVPSDELRRVHALIEAEFSGVD